MTSQKVGGGIGADANWKISSLFFFCADEDVVRYSHCPYSFYYRIFEEKKKKKYHLTTAFSTSFLGSPVWLL